MEEQKKRALLILGVAGLISVLVSVGLGIIIVTFFPLLITFSLLLLGMLCKWLVEWCIIHVHIFKIRERGAKLKEKLKIDEGIKAVKDSYDVIKK